MDNTAATETEETPIDLNTIFKPDGDAPDVGSETEPTPAPAVPTAPDPAKAVEEKSAARFAALAREERKIRAERDALKKDKYEVEQSKIKWSKIGSAPLDVIKEHGLDPEEFINRVVNDGKPSAEHLLSDLQRQVAELKAERERTLEESKAAQYEMAVTSAKSEFANYIEDMAANYPLLYEFEPSTIGDVGWTTAHALATELDRAPTQDEIAERIESRLQAIQKVRDERKAKLTAKLAPAVPVAPSAKAAKTTSPKTLSNVQQSEKLNIPREQTPEEIDAESIRILQAHGWR